MNYNFDEIIDRAGTNSAKWEPEALKTMFGSEDVLPFWVADMDFRTAQPIIDGIIKRAEHGIYGYSLKQAPYYEAIINWTKRRFDYDIKGEWIVYTPGIVPAINYAIQSYCKAGDKVIIQEPVYYPFKKAIENNGCHMVNNELLNTEDGYRIDFEDLEEKAKDPKAKMLILCSPHNPVGRVWTREELTKIGDICLENDVIVLADEIHNDLILFDNKHIIFSSIKKEFEDITITCTAPSKTFNLAGMQASSVIIPNEKLRTEFNRTLERHSLGGINAFSIVALIEAYNNGEEWLEQLLEYLSGNAKFIKDFLAENLPKAKMADIQGTYLAWIDLSEYTDDAKDLEYTVTHEGRIACDGGSWFGPSGNGFIRINFACPRELLEEGLNRLKNAMSKYE